MARYDRYRIQGEPEWRALVPQVEAAPVGVLSACLRIVSAHALEALAESGWKRVDDIRRDATLGAEGRERIKAVAEAEDNAYLDALNDAEDLPSGDPAHDRVHALFAVGRALSAIVYATEDSADAAMLAGAVLEGAYELTVTSEERNAKLRTELEGAVTRLA